MIEGFKKSKFGQLIITGFVAASATAVITTWLYESIRIPGLEVKVSVRDDKIGELQTKLAEAESKRSAAETGWEAEKLKLAQAEGNSQQTQQEISELAKKLENAQAEQARLADELATVKVSRFTNELATTITNKAQPVLTFQQAVQFAADQEDAVLLGIDNDLTKLRVFAQWTFQSEFEDARSATQTNLEVYFTNLITKGMAFHNFRLALHRLKDHLTKETLSHYREQLSAFESTSSPEFLTNVRRKPAFLGDVRNLIKGLQSNENPTNWNANAEKIVDKFIDGDTALATIPESSGSKGKD